MLSKENYRSLLPPDLYAQIEELCADVRMMQDEAVDILCQTHVPDARDQLNDVLKSTEDATNDIIDCVTALFKMIDGDVASEGFRSGAKEHLTKIFEACNFQDLTGQRIKKVLRSFGTLEVRLAKLAETAKKYAGPQFLVVPKPTAERSELEGPQPLAIAPTQEEIDAILTALESEQAQKPV